MNSLNTLSSTATQGQLDIAKDISDIKLLLGYLLGCAFIYLGYLLVRFIYYQFNNIFR